MFNSFLRGFFANGQNSTVSDTKKEKIVKREPIIKKEIEEKNDIIGYNFNFNFFKTDLVKNKKLITGNIEGRQASAENYESGIQSLKDSLGDAQDMEERYEIMQQIHLMRFSPEEKPPRLSDCLDDPYFFFCTDDNLTYISNKDINFSSGNKRFMPFTAARAQALRYRDSGSDKHELIIRNGELISAKSLGGKRTQTQYSINATEVRSIDQVMEDREQKTSGKKTTGIGDISKLLEAEQNEVMASPVDGITLVSGVAGSGKTNVLLHRIQYLLWEQPGKKDGNDIRFSQDNMLFLCFNRALQKYLQTSIKDKFPSVIVKTIDQWLLDIFHFTFHGAEINFNVDKDISFDEVKKTVYNYINTIESNDDLMDLLQIERKGGKGETKNVIVNFKGEVLNRILRQRSINEYTKKHLYIWLYLLSITKLKQKGPYVNEYSITIGDKVFKGFSEGKASKEGYNFTFKKPFYDHIFIDEVQDLSKLHLQIVNGFHNNSMTIAGDETQLIVNGRIGGSLDEVFGLDINYRHELHTSFRSSQQTSLFANEFLKNVKIKNSIGAISFKGLKPIVRKVQNLSEEYQYLYDKISDLLSNESNVSICVMYPKTDSSIDCANKLKSAGISCYLANGTTWNFSNAVHITNYFQAKGLEFDYVFICGINDFDGRSLENKNNIMFTLITRGIKRVYLIQRGGTPKLLKGIDPDTYILQ